jgi:predicted nucleic acid-binding protein
MDESVTLALVRTHNPLIAVDIGHFIMDSSRIEKMLLTEDDFNHAWIKFQKLGKKFLSFTDCVTLVITEKHGVSKIMSFDSHFDGPMERIH